MVVLTLLAPAGASAAPEIVATIPLPGTQPLALGHHEGNDRLFVTDDDSGSLLTIDPGSRQVVASAPVGAAAFYLAVSERHGKVYVASNSGCCTTGIGEGNGLISVVDAATGALLRQLDPGFGANVQYTDIESDEVHGRIYVSSSSGVAAIDAATDTVAPVTAPAPFSGQGDDLAVGAASGDLLIADLNGNTLVHRSGASGAVDVIDLGALGAAGPLDVALNDGESKLYATMLHVPGQAEIAILIHDRDTGAHGFVGRDDLEPLAFNPRSNRLFSGVQVGERGGIVDGASDLLFPVALHRDPHIGAAITAVAVRVTSDNAYMANDRSTFVLNGARRCADRLVTGGRGDESGIVLTGLAIDERRGLVYVANDDDAPQVAVIRDDRVACRPPAPPFRLRLARSQRAPRGRGPSVVVSCPSAPCTARVSARLSVPGASRRFRLRGARRSIAAGRSARLVVRMPASARRALSRGRRGRARLTIVVSGENGGRTVRRRSVRVSR